WVVSLGRTIAPANDATAPSVAHVIARGHQSRLASARSPASIVTSGHASRSQRAASSSISAAPFGSEAPALAAPPSAPRGAVGSPLPGSGPGSGGLGGIGPSLMRDPTLVNRGT